MNRQRLILSILLLLLLLVLVRGCYDWPRQKTADHLKYAPGTRAPAERKRAPARAAASLAAGNALRLDLLDREQPVFKGYRRNIFKPVFVDGLKMIMPKVAKPVPPPVVAPPPMVAAPPRQELARFTFLGFLKKDNRKTIFLAKDKDIILIRAGDVVAGRYEAASLTDQALTIRVRDTGEQIVIPLFENRALGASR